MAQLSWRSLELPGLLSPQSKGLQSLLNARRRQAWLIDGASAQKLSNAALAGWHFLQKSERLRSHPVFLKIDLSPVCNLSCTVCVHADDPSNPDLARQVFQPQQRIAVELFKKILDEARGKTAALSLYYLGDPLTHPQLPELASLARDAGMNTHISSNFSFNLSDERIRDLIDCGLTHISVAVDGISQSTYERTRVGGRLDWVLSNLERLVAYRRRRGLRFPRLEVQYIRFQHNEPERAAALRYFRSLGVDQIFEQWGSAHNYTDTDVGHRQIGAPRDPGNIPKCWWPYLAMVIRYDGAVIPCCSLRLGEQYAPGGDARPLGNVAEQSLGSIWNGDSYRAVRRLLADPKRAHRGPGAEGLFCHGCNNVYETNVDNLWRSGATHPVFASRRERLKVTS